MNPVRLLLAILVALAPLAAMGQTEATCRSWLATDPSPASLPALTGPGAAQRAALLADGGKLVTIGSRYYVAWFPAGFFTATTPVVVLDLHGTGGYPEAEWNDWHASMQSRGIAFLGLAWGGGTPSAETDATVYTQLQSLVSQAGANCPVASARKWLMGFSVGSAVSFAIMVRDTAGARLLRGQLAISGAAISPLVSGIAVMHPTVEAAKANPAAVQGVRSWMYCGGNDFDHSWSMCDEMPYGMTFITTHGGTATLYANPTGTHHSLPADVAGRTQMFDFLVALDSQAIALGAAPTRAYVGGTVTVSGTGGGSGNAVVFTSQTTGVCTVGGTNGTTVTGVAAGTCTLAADQAGNADYSAAAQVTLSFPVAACGATSGDCDGDGIPDAVETAEGTHPATKDNDVFANARLFAMQQYRDFLNREGDAGGITGWTSFINGGGTRGTVVEGFFASAEFQGTISPVARLYFAYFLRVPDYAGLQFWIDQYRGGMSLATISGAFAASAEFVTRYGSLDNTQFVTLVYQNVLGRAPDAAGLAFWVGQLNAGMTRGTMMTGFSESAEYIAAIRSEVNVTMTYIGMLRRAPDAGGFSFWVGYLDGGNSQQALINGFLGAAEYRLRFLP